MKIEYERVKLERLFASAEEVWRIGNWLMWKFRTNGKAFFRYCPKRREDEARFQYRVR